MAAQPSALSVLVLYSLSFASRVQCSRHAVKLLVFDTLVFLLPPGIIRPVPLSLGYCDGGCLLARRPLWEGELSSLSSMDGSHYFLFTV